MSTRELSREDWQKLLEEPWALSPDSHRRLAHETVLCLTSEPFTGIGVAYGETEDEALKRAAIAMWGKRALSILLDEQKAAQLPEGLERTEVLRRACIARIQLLDDIEAELPT